MRWRALKTLNNSHSPGKTTPMHFLLTDLTRMLEFSSDDEVHMGRERERERALGKLLFVFPYRLTNSANILVSMF